jgi:hypothetical protein
MSFAAITLCVASQRVFVVVVYFVTTQSGNFWIHPHIIHFKVITWGPYLVRRFTESSPSPPSNMSGRVTSSFSDKAFLDEGLTFMPKAQLILE